jgi:hypothetical protein
VGLAWQCPIAYGWSERHVLPVVGEGPLGRREWRNDLLTASAGTEVRACAELDGDVENAVIQGRRERLNELRVQMPDPHLQVSILRW